MRAYIAVSFSNRKKFEAVISVIKKTLSQFNIQAFVFTDEYQFDSTDEKQLMQQAMSDIQQSDFLIAETSEKAIGIGIEAGYAKALNKPVVYLRQQDTEHSTTLSGISNYQLIYKDTKDLKDQLEKIIASIKQKFMSL